jgi:hypothetical protein
LRLEFRVSGSRLRVQELGFKVSIFTFRVGGCGFKVLVSTFRAQGCAFKGRGSRVRVQRFGLKVSGSGFRVQGARFRCLLHRAGQRTVRAPYNTTSGRDCVKSLRLCLNGTCLESLGDVERALAEGALIFRECGRACLTYADFARQRNAPFQWREISFLRFGLRISGSGCKVTRVRWSVLWSRVIGPSKRFTWGQSVYLNVIDPSKRCTWGVLNVLWLRVRCSFVSI